MSITLVAPPAEVKALIRLVVTDPEGKVISDSGEQPSHSFVIGFLKLINGIFDGVTIAHTQTTGAAGAAYSAGDVAIWTAYINAPINNSFFGIVVGTGDTAEANTDYQLGTQLTEGTGAGNITHNACTINASAAVVGANVDMVILRSFTNNTGNLITVKETGIYARREAALSAYTHYMHARDVLASATDVPDKCSLSVFYTLRTTV